MDLQQPQKSQMEAECPSAITITHTALLLSSLRMIDIRIHGRESVEGRLEYSKASSILSSRLLLHSQARGNVSMKSCFLPALEKSPSVGGATKVT